MQSRNTHSREHRFSIGTVHHADCAARARAKISGHPDAGVFAKCARVFPVEGSTEGIVSTGMTVAAISWMLSDSQVQQYSLSLDNSAEGRGPQINFQGRPHQMHRTSYSSNRLSLVRTGMSSHC